MTYRLPNLPPERRRHLSDVATPVTITVDNGTISRIDIPCSYVCPSPHDRPLHDHLGWPYPGHPDQSCQLPSNVDKVILVNEMNLPDEGYTDIEVAFVEQPEGLSIEGDIDLDTVWLTIIASCESAITEDIEAEFAAYATGLGMDDDGNMTVPLRDVIAKGTIRVIAGPIVTEGE